MLPEQDPKLAAEYERYMHSLKDVLPITPEVKAILHSHYDFDTTPVHPRLPHQELITELHAHAFRACMQKHFVGRRPVRLSLYRFV